MVSYGKQAVSCEAESPAFKRGEYVNPRKTRPQKVGQNTVVKEIHKYIFYGWAAE